MSDVVPAVPANGPVDPPQNAPADPPQNAPVNEGEGKGEDTRDAEIAELRRQLEAAKPILQAHKDAEEANKTELQKAQERAAQLESELTASREAAARATVAAKTGLAPEVVALLQGATEADLLAAAEKVKAAVGPVPPSLRNKPAPRVGGPGSSSGGEGDASDPAKLAERIRAQMPY